MVPPQPPGDFAQVAARSAASLVALEFESTYALGFVATDDGCVITALHMLVGEERALARTADGRTSSIAQVKAVDARRDLAVLQLGLTGVAPLPIPPGDALVEEGTRVFLFSLVGESGRTRWIESRISEVQKLGDWLTLYRLEGELPPDVSGGPVLSEQGALLGVATVNESEHGMAGYVVPLRYLREVLSLDAPQAMGSILPPSTRRRRVPQHALALLDGASLTTLEGLVDGIAGAIEIGAPAYNLGDAGKCYQVYSETARSLRARFPDCPGAHRALGEGLTRAEALEGDVDGQAWAMRDAFDGLLQVIRRYFQARAALASGPPKARDPLLN